MLERPKLFGADYSVYVRIVRLCLIEKGIDYQLIPIDIFAESGPPASFLSLHPFGRIPAFEYGPISLYETSAITRFVDEAFEGPRLQTSDAAARARCNQLISIADNYLYPHLVWGIYVERVSKPAKGIPTDEESLSSAISKARICLAAMARLMSDSQWLVGDELTLADLYAAPMFDYFLMTPEGRELIQEHENLTTWWSKIMKRQSMIATKPN